MFGDGESDDKIWCRHIQNSEDSSHLIELFIKHGDTGASGETRTPNRLTGVALRSQHETYAELFDRADAALYASKRLGRNRVSLADESVKTFQANQINTN